MENNYYISLSHWGLFGVDVEQFCIFHKQEYEHIYCSPYTDNVKTDPEIAKARYRA
jgi:hypothetical protein